MNPNYRSKAPNKLRFAYTGKNTPHTGFYNLGMEFGGMRNPENQNARIDTESPKYCYTPLLAGAIDNYYTPWRPGFRNPNFLGA